MVRPNNVNKEKQKEQKLSAVRMSFDVIIVILSFMVLIYDSILLRVRLLVVATKVNGVVAGNNSNTKMGPLKLAVTDKGDNSVACSDKLLSNNLLGHVCKESSMHHRLLIHRPYLR